MSCTWTRAVIVALVALCAAACGGRQRTISGTRIADTSTNRELIDIVESYRLAVENRDAQKLMLMASEKYWEDSGTPTGSDDYGLDGLREVLQTRLQQADQIRYSMRYVSIRRACPNRGDPEDLIDGCVAHIEVLIDASFTIIDAQGAPRRPDKRDQNELVLEYTCPQKGNGCKWLFIRGM